VIRAFGAHSHHLTVLLALARLRGGLIFGPGLPWFKARSMPI
jgi:hypothetical protein